MNDKRPRRRMNLSSLIGWLIFILVLAGGPIFRLIGQAFNGANLPPNLPALVIGGLVGLSVLVSLVRAVGGRVQRSGDQRLPTSASPARAPSAPMPPFGGAAAGRATSLPPSQPIRMQRELLPGTPQYEPLINPRIVLVAVAGLVLLGGLALVLLVGNVL